MNSDTSYIENVKILLEELMGKNSHLFNKKTIDSCIFYLDCMSKNESYSFLGEDAKKIFSSVENIGGEGTSVDFYKCILLRLIEQFSDRITISEHIFPDSIINQFYINFQRIVSEMSLLESNHYNQSNDLFLKDLGICRQKLIPVGPRVIEAYTGYSRKVLISGSWKQFFKFLFFFIFIEKNNSPFYQTHVHLSLVKHFNPQEIYESYLRIAELLELNSDIKGLFGASWYYDPALEQISPHLSYLRQQQEDNGAWIFYIEEEKSGNPFARSKSRKKLFEEGSYKPKIYLCIWPRKSILNFSRSI